MDFILSTIRKDYFDGKVSEDEILRFLKALRDVPAVMLLLDGFNEVTVENSPLLIQLRKLMEQARGVQVVITSRYDMRKTYGWEHLHLLELRGLEEKQVRDYLEKKKSKMPSGHLPELLRNPMMLTLYTSTCEVQGKYEGDFKRQLETAGELLWNFMEAQVAVLLEQLNYDENKWWCYKFLLKFMLPAMGYEMEKAGLFAFDRETLYGVLDTYCNRFSLADFFETFAGFDEYEEALPLGACEDDKECRKRRSEIVDILCKKLLMLVKEGETFRFLHQDFRDYFAALHILHEMEMGGKRGEVADVLKQRALPVYIRRFMGEIEGEHYQKPFFQTGKGWLPKEDRSSLLNRILGLCRGVFDGSVEFGLWNIIEVWKEVRGELSGAELSDIDLSRVLLNGTLCSRFFKNDYLAANLDGSLLHEMSIFPRGHSSAINSAEYSGNGKKMLSASSDNTIKEWDVESRKCLKTYKGDLKVEENPGGTGKELFIHGNEIRVKYFATIRTFINIPGLFIQGCSFKNLHPDSDLSEESKNLLRQYGALL